MVKKKKSVDNSKRNLLVGVVVLVVLFTFAYYAGGYGDVSRESGLGSGGIFGESDYDRGSAAGVADAENGNSFDDSDPESSIAGFVLGDTEGGDCGGLCGVGEICSAGTCVPDGVTCFPACLEGEECTAGVCTPQAGACSDESCRNADPNFPYCENDVCVACIDDANKDGCSSPPNTVCDETTNTCVECVDGNDCGGLLCDTTVNQCVECITDDDCASRNCQLDHTCEPIGDGTCTTEGEDCPDSIDGNPQVCDGMFCVLVTCAPGNGFCLYDQDCQCRDGEESATCEGVNIITGGTCSWAGA